MASIGTGIFLYFCSPKSIARLIGGGADGPGGIDANRFASSGRSFSNCARLNESPCTNWRSYIAPDYNASSLLLTSSMSSHLSPWAGS